MGRLGHGNDVDQHRPQLVAGLSGHVVTAICASAHNTGVVTSSHAAYVWGSAAICGSDQTPSFAPKQIAAFLTKQNVGIAQLAMGTNHAVLITQGQPRHTRMATQTQDAADGAHVDLCVCCALGNAACADVTSLVHAVHPFLVVRPVVPLSLV